METLVWLGGGAAALIAVGAVGRVLYRVLRRFDDFLTDWNGEPARPGHPEVPSMPARVYAIEQRLHQVEVQVTPNGGNTQNLGDRVLRIEQKLADRA